MLLDTVLLVAIKNWTVVFMWVCDLRGKKREKKPNRCIQFDCDDSAAKISYRK